MSKIKRVFLAAIFNIFSSSFFSTHHKRQIGRAGLADGLAVVDGLCDGEGLEVGLDSVGDLIEHV